MEERRQSVADATTWVVKVGSRSLTDDNGRLDRVQVANLARQLLVLVDMGKRCGVGFKRCGREWRWQAWAA